MEASRDIGRLIEIMVALRDPVGGCPWDVEQDFASIAPYTIEEAYEVADAIERRDAEDLREELGDLLLQVVYHAQMASERGLFGFDDVVETITRKMIRRHPHVFGDAEAREARSAKGQWERIKAEERAEKEASRRHRVERATETGSRDWDGSGAPAADGHLAGIPHALPALTLALKIQQRAARVGFDWKDAGPIRAKIEEEITEFDEALASGSSDAVEAEFGDVLFSLVNLARHHEIDAEKALRRSVAKFRARFDYIETHIAKVPGRSLQAASLDEMEALWVEAKTAGVHL